MQENIAIELVCPRIDGDKGNVGRLAGSNFDVLQAVSVNVRATDLNVLNGNCLKERVRAEGMRVRGRVLEMQPVGLVALEDGGIRSKAVVRQHDGLCFSVGPVSRADDRGGVDGRAGRIASNVGRATRQDGCNETQIRKFRGHASLAAFVMRPSPNLTQGGSRSNPQLSWGDLSSGGRSFERKTA